MTYTIFEPTEKRLFVAFFGISLENKLDTNTELYLSCENFANFLEKEIIPLTKTKVESSTKKEFDCLDPSCKIKGYSINLLLSESHCGVHFTPEKNYLSVEISTCGRTMPENALEKLLSNINHQSFRCVFDTPTIYNTQDNHRLEENSFIKSLSDENNLRKNNKFQYYGKLDLINSMNPYGELIILLNEEFDWNLGLIKSYIENDNHLAGMGLYGKKLQK